MAEASTEENLKAAFSGESQANRKYLAFAKKAEEEGFSQAAKLFRAAAEAETVHALNHLNAMKTVKSTKENLEDAIKGENYEFKEMYPGMIKTAEKEKKQDAFITFFRANKVEEIHSNLYKKALDSIKTGKDPQEKEIYVCPVCGNTVEDEAPDVCQICGTKKDMFKHID